MGTLFVLYAVTLCLGVRGLSHQILSGWVARLGVMAGLALGLWPWAGWLAPRVARMLGLLGRTLLLLLYFTVLVPFALVVRLGPDPLRGRRPARGSRWLARRPLPNTIDAARLEY